MIHHLILFISIIIFLLFRRNQRYIMQFSFEAVYDYDLNINKSCTDTSSSLTVIEPPMEWTLDTVIIDDFPSNSKMSTHVCTICMQSVNNSFFTSEHDNILPGNVDCFRLSFLQFIRM